MQVLCNVKCESKGHEPATRPNFFQVNENVSVTFSHSLDLFHMFYPKQIFYKSCICLLYEGLICNCQIEQWSNGWESHPMPIKMAFRKIFRVLSAYLVLRLKVQKAHYNSLKSLFRLGGYSKSRLVYHLSQCSQDGIASTFLSGGEDVWLSWWECGFSRWRGKICILHFLCSRSKSSMHSSGTCDISFLQKLVSIRNYINSRAHKRQVA